MASKGQDVVWSFQCFMSVNTFGDYDSMPGFFTHEQKVKGVAVGKGAVQCRKLMNEHMIFTVGGSDMFGSRLVERIKEDITCNVEAGLHAGTGTEALDR